MTCEEYNLGWTEQGYKIYAHTHLSKECGIVLYKWSSFLVGHVNHHAREWVMSRTNWKGFNGPLCAIHYMKTKELL